MTAPALPVLLPPPGPALLLHQAADKLRTAALAARAAGRTPTPAEWFGVMDNALGGPVGVLCGLLSPGLALDLADWLDDTAAEAVRQARAGGSEEAVAGGYPTTIAQHILAAS